MITIKRTSRGKYYYTILTFDSKTFTTRQQCCNNLRSLKKHLHKWKQKDDVYNVKSNNGHTIFTCDSIPGYGAFLTYLLRKELELSRYYYQGIIEPL